MGRIAEKHHMAVLPFWQWGPVKECPFVQHLCLFEYRQEGRGPAVEIRQGLLPISSAAPAFLAPSPLLDNTHKIDQSPPAHIGGDRVFFGPGPDAAGRRRGQSAELCRRYQCAPGVISGKSRRVWPKHLMTDPRVNAIRTDHQIRLNAPAICQNHLGAVFAGRIAAHRATGLHSAGLQRVQPRA